jgi:transaldolase
MKVFIDTADLDEIKTACSWGIVDGVTTNPSLIKKAIDKRGGKIAMDDYIKEIVATVPGPVSLEVIALDADGMVKQARMLYERFSPYGNAVIKIPINPRMDEDAHDFDGLKAIKRLSEEKIPINATLIMTPEQALLAAKAGAAYASPFAGRIDDYIREKMGVKFQKGDYFDHQLIRRIVEEKLREIIKRELPISKLYLDEDIGAILSNGLDNGVWSGVDLVRRIVKIYRNYGFETKVIAASLRNARQVREVAELGVDIATMPFEVAKEMIQHYKTLQGIKNFTADVVPAYEKLFK